MQENIINEKISLVQIKADEKVKILEILGGSNLESRLLSMGVIKVNRLLSLAISG